jgi:hypothetical protein
VARIPQGETSHFVLLLLLIEESRQARIRKLASYDKGLCILGIGHEGYDFTAMHGALPLVNCYSHARPAR